MRQIVLAALLIVVLACAVWAQHSASADPLTFDFSGGYGQAEVGGRYAGAEFHGSRPLPSRISFYYPVANSIDLSTDYWKRGESQPMAVGIRVDGSAGRWIGKEAWRYRLSPHTVTFFREENGLTFSMRYDFGYHEPVMVYRLTVRNTTLKPKGVELYVHLKTTLRTCQTYARFDSAWVSYDSVSLASSARFDEPQTASACVVVQNVVAKPSGWTFDADQLAVSDTGTSSWVRSGTGLGKSPENGARRFNAFSAFTYGRELKADDSLEIALLIGSCRSDEAAGFAKRLRTTWAEDVDAYDRFVRRKAMDGTVLRTGDAWVDRSVIWATALLAANVHYLDGAVVPMPCPAEYNFFFTHDVLLTDLSAVLFDPDRVRGDLLYLLQRAKGNDLPHAYYWKDDGFKTEYCNPGNWNNLWIILATAAYLRHTFDDQTALRLYPLLTRALEKTLMVRKGNVLHGSQPDWWDFGHAPGARAYLTILTIRAIEEYVFLSARLRKNLSHLATYEQVASDLRRGLLDELWNEPARYLLNTTAAGLDKHIYMGPLLAAVFGLLPGDDTRKLVTTAGAQLLDPAVGIRTVSPADFHTDSVKTFYAVKSNEAGDQYLYANGGIWYLGNAWYAWALRSIGEVEGSFDFFRRTMTLDGILQSPRGQPALYEYRYADSGALEHGRVDKPTLMWSAGFCIGTAFRMAGFEDNIWNVTIAAAAPAALERVQSIYAFGRMKTIERSGKGSMVTRLAFDGREAPSRVLPLDAASASAITVEMGPMRYPFLDSVNAVLHTASLDPHGRTMKLALSSFEGHPTIVRILTPWRARSVSLNRKPWHNWSVSSTPLGTLTITVRYAASTGTDAIQIQF